MRSRDLKKTNMEQEDRSGGATTQEEDYEAEVGEVLIYLVKIQNEIMVEKKIMVVNEM